MITVPAALLILSFGPFMTWCSRVVCIATLIVNSTIGYKLVSLSFTPLQYSNKEHKFIFWGIIFMIIISVFGPAPLLFGANMPYGGGFFGGEYPLPGTVESFFLLSLPIFSILIIQIFLSISGASSQLVHS
jgi:hypothetical protein